VTLEPGTDQPVLAAPHPPKPKHKLPAKPKPKAESEKKKPDPLYPRLLQLKNVHPNGWQRAALVEGMALLGALAALADRATSWAPLILPVVAAGVVKFHDVLAGVLPESRSRRHASPPE
jgi:hypothetical protein